MYREHLTVAVRKRRRKNLNRGPPISMKLSIINGQVIVYLHHWAPSNAVILLNNRDSWPFCQLFDSSTEEGSRTTIALCLAHASALILSLRTTAFGALNGYQGPHRLTGHDIPLEARVPEPFVSGRKSIIPYCKVFVGKWT